jgi:hypothetical protein
MTSHESLGFIGRACRLSSAMAVDIDPVQTRDDRAASGKNPSEKLNKIHIIKGEER